MVWEFAAPRAPAVASPTAGAVRRRVGVVDVEGIESVAVRSVLQLTLGHDDRVRRRDALRFLGRVHADLEGYDVTRAAAELLSR